MADNQLGFQISDAERRSVSATPGSLVQQAISGVPDQGFLPQEELRDTRSFRIATQSILEREKIRQSRALNRVNLANVTINARRNQHKIDREVSEQAQLDSFVERTQGMSHSERLDDVTGSELANPKINNILQSFESLDDGKLRIRGRASKNREFDFRERPEVIEESEKFALNSIKLKNKQTEASIQELEIADPSDPVTIVEILTQTGLNETPGGQAIGQTFVQHIQDPDKAPKMQRGLKAIREALSLQNELTALGGGVPPDEIPLKYRDIFADIAGSGDLSHQNVVDLSRIKDRFQQQILSMKSARQAVQDEILRLKVIGSKGKEPLSTMDLGRVISAIEATEEWSPEESDIFRPALIEYGEDILRRLKEGDKDSLEVDEEEEDFLFKGL